MIPVGGAETVMRRFITTVNDYVVIIDSYEGT